MGTKSTASPSTLSPSSSFQEGQTVFLMSSLWLAADGDTQHSPTCVTLTASLFLPSWARVPPKKTKKHLPLSLCLCLRSGTWTLPMMPAQCWPTWWRR